MQPSSRRRRCFFSPNFQSTRWTFLQLLAGYMSWREETTGSWYITALVEVFQEHAHDTHILDMLTMVGLYI